jgi:low affinity Fe/Cu permease
MEKLFARFASGTAKAAGTPIAFLLCLLSVVVWAATGPMFKFSETWQLVINTGTTIITFLMVFLIQNSQNRDGQAIQTKLDELIRASEAENEFMGIEHLTDKELDALHVKCERAARQTAFALERAAAEKKARQEPSRKVARSAGRAEKPKPAAAAQTRRRARPSS